VPRSYLLGPVLALGLLPANVVAAAVPLLQREWEASAAAVGWVFASYQLGYVLSVLVLLPLTDRIPARRVIVACVALTSLGALYGLLVAADSPIYSTAVTELAPIDRLGSAQAMQASFGFAASILAPVAAGFVLDVQLGWGAVFALAGLVGMALALPLAYSLRHQKT
jgi:MFS family permease